MPAGKAFHRMVYQLRTNPTHSSYFALLFPLHLAPQSHLKIRDVSDFAFTSLLVLLFLIISPKEDCFHTLCFKEQKVSCKVCIKSNKLENNQEQILSESILSPLFPAWYGTCWLLWHRFPRIYPVLDLRSHSCKVLLVHDTQWITKDSDFHVGSSKIIVKYELEWNFQINMGKY